jgi:ribulose-phosphate 3-epimerase
MPVSLSFAPSLIAASPLDLATSLRQAEEAGTTILHIDIMDGHFVPNLTYGPDLVKALRSQTSLFFDVHLMVKDPQSWMSRFHEAGADGITIHLEATPNWLDLLHKIKALGNCQAGIAINPQTPLSHIPEEAWAHIDRLIIMTVEPGFSGQSFIPSWEKIHDAALIKLRHPHVTITIDGGVNDTNVQRLAQSGVDVAVLGSAFYHQPDPVEACKNLRALLVADS